jgi:hypothetical protein
MRPSGLWKALLDAMIGEANRLAGQAITELTTPLAIDETGVMNVASTIRFGEEVDGTNVALVLVGGEIILATGRTLTSFTTLSRGVRTTTPALHPPGTLVYDLTRNRTAVDLVRRGLFVGTARGEDLDVIGRNLGLHKCAGLDEETWRSLIQVMAYLPNQPIDAFKRVLDVFPGVNDYIVYEEPITHPNVVFVEVRIPTASSLRGRFFLNGAWPAQIDGGGTTVTLAFQPNEVRGIYYRNDVVLRGERDPVIAPNIYAGTRVGPVLDLLATAPAELLAQNVLPGDPTISPVTSGSFPLLGPYSVQLVDGLTNEIVTVLYVNDTGQLVVDPATPILNAYTAGTGTVQRVYVGGEDVIVDAGEFTAHYLATDETDRYPADGDYFPYFSDPSAIVRCLLDQVRAAGVRVVVTTTLV